MKKFAEDENVQRAFLQCAIVNSNEVKGNWRPNTILQILITDFQTLRNHQNQHVVH